MYKTSYLKAINEKRRKLKLLFIGLSLIILIIASFGILAYLAKYENMTVERTWQSEETGVILSFDAKGQVTFSNDKAKGTYHIISPSTMEYSIDGKTFLMTYRIDQEARKLYWGTDPKHLECFLLK